MTNRLRETIAHLSAGSMLLLPACTSIGATTPIETTTATVPAAHPPVVEIRGVCIDSTESMPAGLASAAVEAVARFVEAWPPEPTGYEAGAPSAPGLDLAVRKILGGSSLDATGELVRVQIPGVPSVVPKPAASDPDFATINRAWREQADAATTATAAAQDRAAADASAIRSADWSSTSSEISGCLTALALTQRGAGARFLLVSDLDQTDPFQSGLGDFAGADVRVVHACTEAVECADQEGAWRQSLTTQGAGDIEFTRPERLDEDLPEWLGAEGSGS